MGAPGDRGVWLIKIAAVRPGNQPEVAAGVASGGQDLGPRPRRPWPARAELEASNSRVDFASFPVLSASRCLGKPHVVRFRPHSTATARHAAGGTCHCFTLTPHGNPAHSRTLKSLQSIGTVRKAYREVPRLADAFCTVGLAFRAVISHMTGKPCQDAVFLVFEGSRNWRGDGRRRPSCAGATCRRGRLDIPVPGRSMQDGRAICRATILAQDC